MCLSFVNSVWVPWYTQIEPTLTTCISYHHYNQTQTVHHSTTNHTYTNTNILYRQHYRPYYTNTADSILQTTPTYTLQYYRPHLHTLREAHLLMTFPVESLYSPLRLTIPDALPLLRWSLVMDMAERSKSGPAEVGVALPSVEGGGITPTVGVVGVFRGVVAMVISGLSNTSPGPASIQ